MDERKHYYMSVFGEVWTTEEAEEVFEFEGFGGGLAFVTRIADGVRGTLNFTPDYPRYYFDFMEA